MNDKRFNCDIDEEDFLIVTSELNEIYLSVYNEVDVDQLNCSTVSLNKDSVRDLIKHLEKLIR